jgi:glycosyltransferase involved in cell wall biosynthesis
MLTSVIIPIWIRDEETLQITKNCIDSFKNAGDVEFVLIDNGCELGGGYLRSEANIYIRYQQNVGFTPAVNAGIKLATGDVIAIANNDIRVPTNWEVVSRELLQDPAVATLHPRMQLYDEPFKFGDYVATNRERWCGNSFVVTSRSFLNRFREAEEGKEPYPGLLDENFGVGGGGDDWDFYFRVRKLGKQCYTNKTAFQHLDSFTLKRMGAERQKIADENDAYFTKKWGIKKEEWFAKEFPDQMKEDWREGFK